jgi:transcriptional regulator with XRE-family HTH domain
MARKKSPPSNEQIGAKLKARRIAQGLTQTQLGEALGVQFQSISQYESGRAAMTALQLVRAADALGCSTLDLIP